MEYIVFVYSMYVGECVWYVYIIYVLGRVYVHMVSKHDVYIYFVCT